MQETGALIENDPEQWRSERAHIAESRLSVSSGGRLVNDNSPRS